MTAQQPTPAKSASNRKQRRRTRAADQGFVPFSWVAILCFLTLSRAFSADVVNGEPVVQPNGNVYLLVQGELRPTLDLARESAFQAAQDRLREWLERQNPPITRVPSLEQIRKCLVGELHHQVESQDGQTMYKVPLQVEFTQAQIQALRSYAAVANGEPVAHSNGDQTFRVQGEFRPTRELARESAMRVAQDRLRDWLARQDPPIARAPSLEQIRKHMIINESRPLEEELHGEKMYKVTMDIKLEPEQVRELRGRERIALATWAFGGLLCVLSVIALLFRLDEWTKGYLTRWLVVAAVGLLGVIAALWWWGR